MKFRQVVCQNFIYLIRFISLLFVFSLSGCSLPSDSSGGAVSASTAYYKDIVLVEYSTTEIQLKLIGQLPPQGTTDMNSIEFHTQSDCRDKSIGSGLASEFTGQGVLVKFSMPSPISSPTTIYLKTNTLSQCLFFSRYTFDPGVISPPIFTISSPASPSRVSYQPALFGTAIPNSVVNFYSDSACAHLVGAGTAANYTTLGVNTHLSQNQSTVIYGQTVDALKNKSACTELTTYVHSTSGPDAPVFSQANPHSPTRTVVNPLIIGTVSPDTEKIKLYNDPSCTNILVEGTKDDFTSTGLSITISENSSTAIYGMAYDSTDRPSICSYMTTYVHDNTPPAAPLFNSTNPATPTRMTIYPNVIGTVAADVVGVRLFRDILCLQPIGYGTKADFETTGVIASVQSNAITSIYATSVDAAGNPSACTFFLNFKNNTIPPEIPVYGGTTPVSPNNQSSTPLVYGGASDTTKNVYFYSDDQCHNQMGFGSVADFTSTGVLINTPVQPNSVNLTTMYVQADDQEGNVSECTALATYAYSTASAASPSFLQTIPSSPSRFSTTPWILGTAPASVVNVQLYKDNACSQFLGAASRAIFATQGIRITVPSNSTTHIYAVSADVYGNTSSCVYFSDYVHDAIVPSDPSFISSTPVSPNNQSVTPSILGGITVNIAGKPLPVSVVNFYDSFLCLSNLGFGTPGLFSTTGVPIAVPSNALTTVYAQATDAAGNVSSCKFMLNYTHSDKAPGKPLFATATPATPSYTKATSIKGTLGTTQDIVSPSVVNFYKDSSCTTFMASGAVSQYTSTGVTLTADANATTTIYARTVDLVGNQSACTSQVDFLHHDTGPTGLMATQNLDGSVTLSWQPDLVANPTARYTVKRSTKAGGPYGVLIWQNAGTSFTDYSVNQSKTYYYVVSALNNTGYSYNSNETSITVNANVTQTPTLLTAEPGPAVVVLSWQGYNPNMYYNILRAAQPGGPYVEVKNHYSGAQYADLTVNNGTNYYYVVQAVNPTGDSVFSNEAQAAPADVPPAPQNLQGSAVNSHSSCGGGRAYVLSWTAPSYYTKFVLGRGYSPGSHVDLVTLTGTSYVDCNPDPLSLFPNGRDVYYSVQATWGPTQQNLRSVESNEVAIRNKVGTVVVIDPGHQEAYVRWSSIITATDYQVWRSTKPGWPNENYTLLAANQVGTSYYDATVVDGQDYYYVVIANYSTSGTSGWPSDEASGLPGANPGAPSNLKLTMDSGNNINLAWTAPSHYNGFYIYRATSAGGPYTYLTTAASNTYSDSPGIGGYYYYYVSTRWGSFESTASNTVSVRYGFPASLSLTANATQLSLSWASVNGANAYRVLRSTSSGGPYTQIATTASLTFDNTTTAPVSYEALGAIGYYYVIQPTFPDATVGQYSVEKNGMLNGSNVVSGLTVTGTTSTSVNLAWAGMNGTSSYTIYKATSIAGPFTSVGASATSTYSVSSLSSSTTYYFKVAKTACAPGCQSTAVSAITVSVPSAPGVDAGLGQVDISWSGVTGASSYDLLRSTDGVNFSVLQSGVSGGAYTDTSVVNGNIYFYQIRANYPTAGSLVSSSSNPVTPGVIPRAPNKMVVVDNSNGTDVALTWGKVPGVSRYKVYYSATSGGPWTLALTTSSNVGNYIMGLTTGAVYYAVVTAVNGTIESSYSAEVSFIPSIAPSAPTLSANTTSVLISFVGVAGAAKYDIQRSVDKVNYTTIVNHQVGTNYTDNAVVLGQSYYYQYLPYDASNNPMALSASGGPIAITPAVAPSGLIAYAPDVNSVRLSWILSVSPQTATYNIYRSTTAGGPYVSVASGLASTINTYLDMTTAQGQVYYYVVTSVNNTGVESNYSNEASARTVAGSINLTAINNNGVVDLTWDAVAAATGYNVYRSLSAGGPYGLISSQGNTLNFSDNQVNHAQTYYYVSQAVFADGSMSALSNEASLTVLKTINLQLPIEMSDQALSSETTPITFERTRTSMDPTAYDGTITYEFEAIALNTDVQSATLDVLDESDNVKATLTVPANTAQPTRLRTGLSLNPTFETYRVKISGTPQSGQLQVFSARIWVTQVGASKTKLYIPLLSSANTPLSGDAFAPVESKTSAGYQILDNSTIYLKDQSKLSKLQEYNAWELEVVVSSDGGNGAVALYNVENNAAVESAEVQFSDPAVLLVNAPFNDGVNLFSTAENLNHYRLAMQCYNNCDLGAVNIFKAGLWVNISNISQAEILIRNSLAARNIGGQWPTDTERSLIDLSKYSHPVVNFRAIAHMSSASGENANISLMTNGSGGSADYGFLGLSMIAGSTLNFTSLSAQLKQTASPLTLNSGERFVPEINPVTGTANLIDSYIIIQTSP